MQMKQGHFLWCIQDGFQYARYVKTDFDSYRFQLRIKIQDGPTILYLDLVFTTMETLAIEGYCD